MVENDPVPYYINESGLKVNANTGELIEEEAEVEDVYFGA